MKKQKNKITHDIHLMIVAKAKELPVQYKTDSKGAPVYKRGTLDGSEVGEDKDGNRGIPGVKYTGMVMQYEDHFQNLLTAYQKDGQQGFNHYVQKVTELHAKRKAFVKKAQPWYIKLITILKFWKR